MMVLHAPSPTESSCNVLEDPLLTCYQHVLFGHFNDYRIQCNNSKVRVYIP